MKKQIKSILSLVICVLIAFSVALTGCNTNDDTSTGSGKPGTSTGSGDSGTGNTHVCESKCPVCGLCLDMECTENACLEKCGDSYAYGTTFTAAQELSVAKTSLVYDKTKGYYTGFNKTNEGAYSYRVNASGEATVNLTAYLYKTSAEDVFTTVIKTTLNGNKLERPSVIPAGSESEIATVNLGCVTLKAGENVFNFIADADGEHAHEMTTIQIAYAEEDAEYTLLPATQVEHTCKSVCEVCSGCKDFSCLNPGCAKKCKCESGTHNAKIFTVLDVRANNNGRGINAEIDGVGCSWGQTTKINYNVSSDTEGKVKIGAVVSSDTTDILFTDQFTLTVNGEKVVGTGKMPVSEGSSREWSNYKMVVIGEINLLKGKNAIEFLQKPVKNQTGAYNFQSMIIFSETGTFDWYVPGPDDHETKLVAAKEATCVATGNTQYYACTHCSKIFEDADAVKEITDTDSVIIAIDPENHVNTTLDETTSKMTCDDCKKFVMYSFSAMDEKCVVEGVTKDEENQYVPGQNKVVNTIKYTIVSDKDVTVPMYVNCSAIATKWEVEFYKTWTIDITTADGTTTNYVSNTIHHNWNSLPASLKDTVKDRFTFFKYEYVCDVTLKAGKNTILFTSTGKESLNFRHLAFKNTGDAILSFGTAE